MVHPQNAILCSHFKNRDFQNIQDIVFGLQNSIHGITIPTHVKNFIEKY